MKKIKVESVFPIREKQQIYINLITPPEYDFTKLKSSKEMILSFADKKVKLKYIGRANIKGTIAISAVLDDLNYRTVEEIGEQHLRNMLLKYDE